jgi:hypothetical protein
VVTEPIRAGQGQIIDIGRIKFKEFTDFDLDGREVWVRVYENWKLDRWAFEMATAAIKERTVYFDFDYPDSQVMVAVIADDQEDPNVKGALGATGYAGLYKEGLSYDLAKYFGKEHKLRTVVDGLGNPIVGATAKIYLKGKAGAIGLSQVVLEDTNLLRIPIIGGPLGAVSVVIEHPDYGTAAVMVQKRERVGRTFFPALKRGSSDYERSIWGTVVDPQGIAVPGVSIRCFDLRSPGGERLTGNRVYEVRTNEQGHFSMYLPLLKGKVVPVGSKYEVRVLPPKRLGLRGPSGPIVNGRETTIALKPKLPELRYFHTVVFEDENGPITDIDKLKKIVVVGKTKYGTHDYIYNMWSKGYEFLPGQYWAKIKRGLKKTFFEPIMITEDSPEPLVFKAKYPKSVYHGRVVDAITTQPIPSVLIMCTGPGADQAERRVANQWKALRALGHDLAGEGDSLAQLGATERLSKVTLTDEQGRFEVVYVSGKDNYFWRFSVVEKGYLGAKRERPYLAVDSMVEPNDHIELGDIRLFPTGKILLEPYFENTPDRPSVRARWRVRQKDNPDWDKVLESLGASAVFSSNRDASMNIAAGLNVRVELFVDESKEKANPRWSPIIIEGLNLDAGETRDLGKLRFEATLPIYARVLDSGGRPVEDVTVRHVNNKFVRTYRASTDGEGMANFSAPSYSRGKFKVLAGKEKDPQFEQFASYEIAGPEDANTVYTLELSDELLEALFR